MNQLERLLYSSDKPLKKAVIQALKLLGYDAKDAGKGTVHDIDLEYSPAGFVGIVEVKGLKQAADLDDMRALLDYYEERAKQQPNLKGIFIVNHFREVEPPLKGNPFTPSSLKLGERKEFCLLTAANLYFALERLMSNEVDAETIRNKIQNGIGLTQL